MSDNEFMQNTKAYQEGFLEGFREGRKKTQQDMQRWGQFCRDTTLSVVQERFPELVDLAQDRLNEVVNLIHLVQLGLNISDAKTLEKARAALEDGGASRLCIVRQI